MDYLEIRTEHIKRARQENDQDYPDRAEEFITQAVNDLARGFRHYDLEEQLPTAFAFVAGTTIYAIPAETQTLVSIEIRQDSDNAFAGTLEYTSNFQAFNRSRTHTARRPSAYSRFGRNIRLDHPPDQAYTGALFHYKYPAAPDFATPTTPELEEVWHPHIIEYSLMIAGNAVGESVVTQQAAQQFQTFLQMMPDARFPDLTFTAPHHDEFDQGGNV